MIYITEYRQLPFIRPPPQTYNPPPLLPLSINLPVSIAAVFWMSHNAPQKVLLGERCVTFQKRLRGRLPIYQKTKITSGYKPALSFIK